MKAAVFHGAGDIRVEEVPDPVVDSTSIIVKVKASGICGSDLHPYRQGGPKGAIFGHEFSGEVVEVGSEAKDISLGDRIVAVPCMVCMDCYWCKQGKYTRCPSLKLPGPDVPGAFAEYVKINHADKGLGEVGVKLPDNLSYEVGSTVEPLSVALYCVNKAQVKQPDTVVVIGAGAIGLGIVQVLKAKGISNIIVSGRRQNRLDLAEKCGAHLVVDAATDDIVKVVTEQRAEKMADVVFECAGMPQTFMQSMMLVHHGGKVALVGLYEEQFKMNLSWPVAKDVSLIGCLGEDFPGSMELISSGKVDTKPLISHEFALDDVKEAFEAAVHAPDAVKVILKP